MNNEMKMEFDAIAENESFARMTVAAFVMSLNPTLEEISDVAHMSKNYFCRQFKKLNGISPWEYITVKRIERAIRYIENTDLARLEIASKCGYNNASNFYHAFKKVTGKAPGDYKNYFL